MSNISQIIKVDEDNMTISARDLHEALDVKTAFKDWFPRMCEYGFSEGIDFCSKMSESTGGRPAMDADISIDMAKEICMIQRTEKGKEIRKYFIDLEKAWNTPEQVMARALKIADRSIEQLKAQNRALAADNDRMKPKEIFADAVSSSHSTILIRDLAKLLRQNGVEIGEKRLYQWMRDNGYIIKNSRQPTQRAMEMGLLEVVERTVLRGDDNPFMTSTTKVTGKGQQYFVNKLLCAN